MTKAIVTGSFDPITVGHLNIIKRAAAMFDEVSVVIFINGEKQYLFPVDVRKKMLEASVASIPNVKTDVCDGLAAEYTKEHGISVMVRGVRGTADADYEITLAAMNKQLGNHPETVFLPADPMLSHISSTFARELIKHGKSLDGIIPGEAIAFIGK